MSLRGGSGLSPWYFTNAPASAIQRSVQSTFVYVVKDDSTVDMHQVRPGPTEGDEVSIANGLAALVTVYIVLGVLYENYIHPITILSTLPSATHVAFDGGRRKALTAVAQAEHTSKLSLRKVQR